VESKILTKKEEGRLKEIAEKINPFKIQEIIKMKVKNILNYAS